MVIIAKIMPMATAVIIRLAFNEIASLGVAENTVIIIPELYSELKGNLFKTSSFILAKTEAQNIDASGKLDYLV